MAHIRSFSVEGPEQDKFKHTFRKVIEIFLEELPSMDTCELAEDEDGRCMICQHEYRSGNRNARLNGAEEAVCLPCGHHAGRACTSEWLQPGNGDSCPLCRKKFFFIAPWPHVIPGENDSDNVQHSVPSFDDICMTLFRSDYALENITAEPRRCPPPGWIVRAAGRSREDVTLWRSFFDDEEKRRAFAREILSTPPAEVENAAWMLLAYPDPNELEAHVEALTSVLGTADPKGVIYIQLRDGGGATIFQVDAYAPSDKPDQDEGIFRNLVLRGALDGPPLIKEGRQGSWWAYLGDSEAFSTQDSDIWREMGEQHSDFGSETGL